MMDGGKRGTAVAEILTGGNCRMSAGGTEPGQLIPNSCAKRHSAMSTPDRQELLRNAVAFLSDPKVRFLSS